MRTYVFISFGTGVELLGHMVTLCLALYGTTKQFCKAAAPFHITPSNDAGSIPPHPCQYLLLLAVLITANLVGVKW